MPDNDDRSSRRRCKLRQAGAWAGAAALYAAAQGLSAWAAQRQSGTRPRYSQFERPAFAPPGAAFPVVWPALNLATATSAWRIWGAPGSAAGKPSRCEVLAWWAAAIVIRSGYVPLAFGRRRLRAATADAALLFAVIARYALLARRIDQPAALLAVPELIWTAFATVLSTTVAAINSQ
jgi:tryptophan-rich sensory protein